MRAINSRTNQVVLADLREAQSPWQRFAGLMFRRPLAPSAGVLFRPAAGIHTHFMRFAIDLIYLDEQQRVQAIRAGMAPWRWDLRRASAVIEARAGTAERADLRVGDRLRLEGG